MGIPEQDLPHIFEPFCRGWASGARYAGHAGLGLAIARRIMQLQGGDSHVENRAVDDPSFYIRLPLYSQG